MITAHNKPAIVILAGFLLYAVIVFLLIFFNDREAAKSSWKKNWISPFRIFLKHYFSCDLRLNRQPFAGISVISAIMLAPLYLVGHKFAGLAISVFLVPVFIMRLKDLDWPPFLAIVFPIDSLIIFLIHIAVLPESMEATEALIFIPISIFRFFLTIKRGTKGPNKYGPDPLEEKTT